MKFVDFTIPLVGTIIPIGERKVNSKLVPMAISDRTLRFMVEVAAFVISIVNKFALEPIIFEEETGLLGM